MITSGAKNNMRKNIFISYRVQDTAGETGRLVDSLKQSFEEDQIFMDIDKLEPGVDFTKVISKSLESCDVMLAIIGPNWAGSKNAAGVSRINLPNDWVRLELSTALKRDIRVVPVLVDGATLPDEEELPEDLHSLLRRQTHEISNKRWRYDTEQLVAFLQQSIGIQTKKIATVQQPRTSGMQVWVKALIGGLAFLGLILIVALVMDQGSKKEEVKPEPTNVYTEPNKDPVKLVDPEPAPVVEEPEQPARVDGNWYEASSGITIAISQQGANMGVLTYFNGQNTGSGSGTVTGNRLRFRVQTFYPVVVIDGTGEISNDGSTMEGNVTTTNNGATLTLPFSWVRQ